MAATPVVLNTIVRAGTPAAPTLAACDNVNGNTVPNSGAVWLELSNTGGSSGTVQVAFANGLDGQAETRTITLAAAAHDHFGPWPVALYGSVLKFTASAATVKVAAWQLDTA
jgi:hypothetical protein